MKPIYPIILAIFLFPKINFSQCPVLPEAMLVDAGVPTTIDVASTGSVSHIGSDLAASFAISGRIDFVNDNYDNNTNTGSTTYCDFMVASNSILSCSKRTGIPLICGTTKHYQEYTLPAKFVSFSLDQKGSGVLAQWSITHEHNSKNFEVQRSYNGNDWVVAGTVAATGEFDVVRNYSFLDDQVTKTNVFYRIRHIDVDSRHSSFTNIQSIKLLSPAEAVNIITDSRKNIVLNFYSGLNSKATIQVRSIYGEVEYYSVTTVLFPAIVAIACMSLMAMITYRRRVLANENI